MQVAQRVRGAKQGVLRCWRKFVDMRRAKVLAGRMADTYCGFRLQRLVGDVTTRM